MTDATRSRRATPPALALTERQFQRQIQEVAALYGFSRIYHTFLSRWSDKGFPDCVLVRPATPRWSGRVIYVEVKSEKGKLTEAQAGWIEAREAAGAEVYIWRPHDWDGLVKVLAWDEPPSGWVAKEVNE